MKTVVFSFLGTKLDAIKGEKRWEKWRPNVALCQRSDMVIDKLVLFYNEEFKELLELVMADIACISPKTIIEPALINLKNPWDFEEVYGALYEYARAYAFDMDKYQYLVHIATGTHVAQICLFLLIEAHYFPAHILQTSPPRKQQGEKMGKIDIIDLDLSRYNLLASRFAKERLDSQSCLKSNIATKNTAFNTMIAEIEQVALRSRSPILLLGATGVGKSLLARRVYELKKQRYQLRGEFVEVNCATLRGDSAMSALFGHVKGAFTGALSARAGLLCSANEGLLFLDEIGELGADEQAMLLKAIEEKRFYPVGADKEVSSNFQLMAGTCKNLAEEVRLGTFREDLYARLNMWTFCLPPLSERREDIEPNIEFELARFSHEQGREVRLNKEAQQHYLHYALQSKALWSGNFRDLSSSIQRMATLANGGRITNEDVNKEIQRLEKLWSNQPQDALSLCRLYLPTTWQQFDIFDLYQLEAVLAVCQKAHNLSEAGRLLFAQSRQQKVSTNDADRLKKYLAKFELAWADI